MFITILWARKNARGWVRFWNWFQFNESARYVSWTNKLMVTYITRISSYFLFLLISIYVISEGETCKTRSNRDWKKTVVVSCRSSNKLVRVVAMISMVAILQQKLGLEGSKSMYRDNWESVSPFSIAIGTIMFARNQIMMRIDTDDYAIINARLFAWFYLYDIASTDVNESEFIINPSDWIILCSR